MVTFPAVWEYIEKTRDQVHDLEVRVQKAKDNVEEIQKIMTTWTKQPLFERKEDKYDTLLNLDDREDRINKRYAEVRTYGDKIHSLLKVRAVVRFNSILSFRPLSPLSSFCPSVTELGELRLCMYGESTHFVVLMFSFLFLGVCISHCTEAVVISSCRIIICVEFI